MTNNSNNKKRFATFSKNEDLRNKSIQEVTKKNQSTMAASKNDGTVTKMTTNNKERPQQQEGSNKKKPKKNNQPQQKQQQDTSNSSSASASIDDLFATKKQKTIEKKEEQIRQQKDEEEELARKRQLSIPIGGEMMKKSKTKELVGDRTDVTQIKKGEWMDDGLGGVFNSDGFTGRRDESGSKIYKAHLFNKKNFGNSSKCPFDCDCCYI